MQNTTRRYAASLLVATLGLIAGCGGGGTGGGDENRLSITSSGSSTFNATAGTALATRPTVLVTDNAGAPKAGVNVTFAITSGGGAMTGGTQSTNAEGRATVGSWTLGNTAGANTMTASLSGATGSPVTFTATGNAGAAAKLAFVTPPSTVPAGATLGNVVVEIRDVNDNRVMSATNDVAIALGQNPSAAVLSGTTTATPVSGRATFTNLSLDKSGASYTLVASATGLTNATSAFFNVTGAVAAAIQKVAGDGLNGTSGVNVTTRPQVRVVDNLGNPVQGSTVTFAVASGNGHATGVTQMTDANGLATVGTWMLGKAGANTLTASVPSITGATFSYTAAAPVSNYNIDLRYVGTPPAAGVQSAFSAALTRWQQVIIGDIPDVQLTTGANSIAAGSCSEPSFPAMSNQLIDDIVILAEVKPIDGAGQILGQAKPCFVRATGRLTIVGYMKFDSADLDQMIANGSLNEVIVHEMGHVLGLGTLWETLLTRYPGSTGQPAATDTGWIRTTDVRWTGATGNNWHGVASGTGGAPVENCETGVPSSCGPGTWLGHWREQTYKNELMTGYISATGNPLSRITIGALADMGYVVNLGAADTYTIPVAASFRGVAPTGIALNELPYTGPIIEIDRNGRFVRRIQ